MTDETLNAQLDREAEAGENYIERIAEAAAEANRVVEFPTPPQSVPQPPPAFVTLSLSPMETLITFQAYRVLLRQYASQEAEPLENIQQLVALMTALKPGAIEASKLFAPQQGGQ